MTAHKHLWVPQDKQTWTDKQAPLSLSLPSPIVVQLGPDYLSFLALNYYLGFCFSGWLDLAGLEMKTSSCTLGKLSMAKL